MTGIASARSPGRPVIGEAGQVSTAAKNVDRGPADASDAPFLPQRSGGPLELPLDLIDEDPKQPRTAGNPGFSAPSLSELAASISLRNVKTPISVRHNLAYPGRFIINHGARRFRASMRAGKRTIPGFIDDDYNETDQVVENLQRNELTAREVADYIGRELAKGMKKGEIAKSISKSPAFVTQHVALLDLPDPIARAFNSGRVRDVTLVNELVTAYKKRPEEVGNWLQNESQDISRGTVKFLREFLDKKFRLRDDSVGEYEDIVAGFPDGAAAQTSRKTRPGTDRWRLTGIAVTHKRREALLILNRRPTTEGAVWLRYQDDGMESEVQIAEVKLTALLSD